MKQRGVYNLVVLLRRLALVGLMHFSLLCECVRLCIATLLALIILCPYSLKLKRRNTHICRNRYGANTSLDQFLVRAFLLLNKTDILLFIILFVYTAPVQGLHVRYCWGRINSRKRKYANAIWIFLVEPMFFCLLDLKRLDITPTREFPVL